MRSIHEDDQTAAHHERHSRLHGEQHAPQVGVDHRVELLLRDLREGSMGVYDRVGNDVSRRRYRAFTSLSRASIAAGLPASARTPEPLGPIAATASSSLCWSRPVTTTMAPFLTNSSATAKPIPCVPPVTTATFPSSE